MSGCCYLVDELYAEQLRAEEEAAAARERQERERREAADREVARRLSSLPEPWEEKWDAASGKSVFLPRYCGCLSFASFLRLCLCQSFEFAAGISDARS